MTDISRNVDASAYSAILEAQDSGNSLDRTVYFSGLANTILLTQVLNELKEIRRVLESQKR
jgi:hypothetical protein